MIQQMMMTDILRDAPVAESVPTPLAPDSIEIQGGYKSSGKKWRKTIVRGMDLDLVPQELGKSISTQWENGIVQAPAGAISTIWTAAYHCKPEFYICQLDPTADEQELLCWHGHVRGRFRIIASAKTATHAPRLLDWWTSATWVRYGAALRPDGPEYTFDWMVRLALNLAEQLPIRGRLEPEPMPE